MKLRFAYLNEELGNDGLWVSHEILLLGHHGNMNC